MTERFAITWPPIRMDHAIIRPSQSLVKGGGPAAQFRLSDGASGTYFFKSNRLLQTFSPRWALDIYKSNGSGRTAVSRTRREMPGLGGRRCPLCREFVAYSF
jgi:hypothetical protein